MLCCFVSAAAAAAAAATAANIVNANTNANAPAAAAASTNAPAAIAREDGGVARRVVAAQVEFESRFESSSTNFSIKLLVPRAFNMGSSVQPAPPYHVTAQERHGVRVVCHHHLLPGA